MTAILIVITLIRLTKLLKDSVSVTHTAKTAINPCSATEAN